MNEKYLAERFMKIEPVLRHQKPIAVSHEFSGKVECEQIIHDIPKYDMLPPLEYWKSDILNYTKEGGLTVARDPKTNEVVGLAEKGKYNVMKNGEYTTCNEILPDGTNYSYTTDSNGKVRMLGEYKSPVSTTLFETNDGEIEAITLDYSKIGRP